MRDAQSHEVHGSGHPYAQIVNVQLQVKCVVLMVCASAGGLRAS